MRIEDVLDQAERAVGRNFTREEWKEIFPDEPYRKTFERCRSRPRSRRSPDETDPLEARHDGSGGTPATPLNPAFVRPCEGGLGGVKARAYAMQGKGALARSFWGPGKRLGYLIDPFFQGRRRRLISASSAFFAGGSLRVFRIPGNLALELGEAQALREGRPC